MYKRLQIKIGRIIALHTSYLSMNKLGYVVILRAFGIDAGADYLTPAILNTITMCFPGNVWVFCPFSDVVNE